MAKVRIRVPIAQWAYGDHVFRGGEHELSIDLRRERDLASALSCAVSAGAIELLEGELPGDAIEDDEVSRGRQEELERSQSDDARAAYLAGAAEQLLQRALAHDDPGERERLLGQLRADCAEYSRRLEELECADEYRERLAAVERASKE